MPLTLLGICTRAIKRISSIQMPGFIVGNTDPTAEMLLAIACDVGEELIRDYNWQQMRTTQEETATADQTLFTLPEDFDRVSLDTMWESGNSRHIFGAQSSRAWQAITNVNGLADNRYRWRLYQDQIQLTPAAPAGLEFNWEYLSKYYSKTAAGVAQEAWTNDTDLPRLPHDLFVAGVRYFFLKEKHLPYGDAEAEYEAVITSRVQGNQAPGFVTASDAVFPPDGRRDMDNLNIPEVMDI
jgi:hypothetical protein